MGAALALAYLAQRFFDNTLLPPGDLASVNGVLAGAILYVAGMILFALFALPWEQVESAPLRRARPERRAPVGGLAPDARIMRPPEREHPTATPAPGPLGHNPANALTQLALLALALAPYALSMVRFYSQGEDATVRWLWQAGLTLFVGGQVIGPALQRVAGPNAEWSPPFRWWRTAILLAILGGGFWLRFNHLAELPQDFHGDMASMGIQARDWLAGRQPNLFDAGWANIPLLGFLPAAISLHFFGNNLFALNLSAVIGGMFTLLGLYLLAWRLFDSHRLAALATAVLAVNIPHIHFSRLAAYMDPWPFMLLALFFLVDGMKARRPQSFALAGVLLGFGVQMYYSGRVIGVVLILGFLYLLVIRPRWIKENILGLVLLITGTLLALEPSLLHFATHREALVERSRAVFLFHEPVMTHLHYKYGLDSNAAVVWEQIKRSLLMFNHSTDSSTQFGFKRPLFSSLLSPLVPLGFAYALRWWRTPGLGLSIIWLTLTILFGSILTNNAPFWPRLVGVLPVAALLAALTLDRLWEALVQLAPQPRRRTAAAVFGLATAVLLLFAGQSNWALYRQTVAHNGRPQALIGRYLDALPDDISACGFGAPYAVQVRETAFQAWPRPLLDLPADTSAYEHCPGPPFVWILSPDDRYRLPALQARWPGGEVQEHPAADGSLLFVSYLVTDALPPANSATPPPVPDPDLLADLGPFTAYLPDGSPFVPHYIFLGDISGVPTEIEIGPVTVANKVFTLRVAPVPEHDAVFDYAKLIAADGTSYLFEAEDATITSGDAFAPREGADGHWWLQSYAPFSNGYGLVAQKREIVPALTTAMELPDGVYTLFIGSFTGDPQNGVFGLGIDYQ